MPDFAEKWANGSHPRGKYLDLGKIGPYSQLKKTGKTHIMNKDTNELVWEVLSHQD